MWHKFTKKHFSEKHTSQRKPLQTHNWYPKKEKASGVVYQIKEMYWKASGKHFCTLLPFIFYLFLSKGPRHFVKLKICCCYSVAKLCPPRCDPHGLQYARLPCPSPSPRACSNVQWVKDAIQPSHPLSSPSPPAFSLFQHQGLFPMSHLFISGGQIIGALVSASVFSMNTQGWFPLGLTGLISLQSKGLSRVSSSTTI